MKTERQTARNYEKVVTHCESTGGCGKSGREPRGLGSSCWTDNEHLTIENIDEHFPTFVITIHGVDIPWYPRTYMFPVGAEYQEGWDSWRRKRNLRGGSSGAEHSSSPEIGAQYDVVEAAKTSSQHGADTGHRSSSTQKRFFRRLFAASAKATSTKKRNFAKSFTQSPSTTSEEDGLSPRELHKLRQARAARKLRGRDDKLHWCFGVQARFRMLIITDLFPLLLLTLHVANGTHVEGNVVAKRD